MAAYQPEGRNRAARRRAEEARKFAISGDWESAVGVNRTILESAPRDIDAMNRLGKSLMEMGNLDEALEVYRQAIAVDPSNVIAQRNAGRIEQLIGAKAADTPAAVAAYRTGNAVQAGVFVEEVGKTFITDLIRPTVDAILTQLAPADEVELRIDGKHVSAHDQHGNLLGILEPKIGQRMVRLIQSGNRFKAYVVALTGVTARIIVREIYHDPESSFPVAFQRQATVAAPRPYLRDTRRMARELEPDLLDDDDVDDEDDDTDGFDGISDDETDEDYTEEEGEAEEEESPLADS